MTIAQAARKASAYSKDLRVCMGLGGDGFDKMKAPIFRFIGLRRTVTEDSDDAVDVVPVDVPLVGLEPSGRRFDVGNFNGWTGRRRDGFVDGGENSLGFGLHDDDKMQRDAT